ncbi:MAG: 4-hydroxy-tetrahydrodipicolinate reductase [Ruminococcaceae bacterium]|nr:4-hydroxy-tetrahydrodipicolinate reductase [Oscillospiraceae bacterium]
MVNILLSGCNGKMGKTITECAKNFDDLKIVCGTDVNTTSGKYPVYSSPADAKEKVDVIIDFSHPSALKGILDYAVKTNTPAVICTTGLDESQKKEIADASEKVAIFFSANMSLGVNLIAELARKATAVLGGQFDIEIVEAHHNQKIDAPSGTALMLADEISCEFETAPKYEFDRHSKRTKRTKNEIGLHAVRGGTIVGEHEIIFAGQDEVIKISHSAMSKQIFANGSLNAALFMAGKTPGMYSMKDIVASM